MATINAAIKMQDLASTTLEQVSVHVDAVEQNLLDLQNTATKLGATDPLHSMVDGAYEAVSQFRQLENELDKTWLDVRAINVQQADLNDKIRTMSKRYGDNSTQVQKLKVQLDKLNNSKDQIFAKQEKIEKSLIKQGTLAKQLTDNINQSQSPTGKLSGLFDGIGGKIIAINQGLQLAKQIVGSIGDMLQSVDNYTLTKARLNSINDNLQTQEELQNKIYASAERSRASYSETADIISKLGRSASNVLTTNDQQIAFAELLNKSFKVSGADDTAVSSAMYNLNQAMSSGVLQGNDFKAITDNAPMLADSIAQYMGVTRAELKKLSSQGAITADIVKNALFSSAEQINSEFEKLPKTFADASNSIKNNALKSFQPVLEMVANMLNSEQFQTFVNTIIQILSVGAQIIIPILQGVVTFISYIGEVFYNVVEGIANNQAILVGLFVIIGIVLATQLIPLIVTAAWNMTMFGIQALIAGTKAFFAMSIIGIPLWAVIAVIGIAIWAAHQMGVSFEEMGAVVGGVFAVLGAFIYNTFIRPIWNYIAAFANFFGNVFNDPVYAIKKLFVDVFSTIIDIVKSAAGVIDFVLGTDMAGAISGFQDDLYGWLGESDKYEAVMPELEEWAYQDAWDTGKKFGGSLIKDIGSAFGSLGSQSKNPIDTSFGDMNGQIEKLISPGGPGVPTNVKGGKLDVDISDEQLKYLRDIAQQEYTLKYKQITPNITLNVGDINEANDGKQLITELQDMLERELADKYVEETA